MKSFIAVCIVCLCLQLAIATKQPDESVWDVIQEQSDVPEAIHPLGTFPTKSRYYEGSSDGGYVIQKLAYNVHENVFGPAFTDGNGQIVGIFEGNKQSSHFRVMRESVLHGYNISCIPDYDQAWSVPQIIFSYLEVSAVLVEGKYIGSYGEICDNGELCARAYDFEGTKVIFKGKTILRDNVCFIVAMGRKAS
uniref:WG repeat-containing protein n=1 Tax=Panagrellus redivivus TaxID=6233 RepID=A0A7E4V2U0_PANRE